MPPHSHHILCARDTIDSYTSILVPPLLDPPAKFVVLVQHTNVNREGERVREGVRQIPRKREARRAREESMHYREGEAYERSRRDHHPQKNEIAILTHHTLYKTHSERDERGVNGTQSERRTNSWDDTVSWPRDIGKPRWKYI